jgi:hypothetical protein
MLSPFIAKPELNIESIVNEDWDPESFDSKENFNIYRLKNPNSEGALSGLFYIFMTCPAMNIDADNMLGNPFLRSMASNNDDRKLLRYLGYGLPVPGDVGNKYPLFMYALTNSAKGFDPPDTTVSTVTFGDTLNKIRHQMAGESNDSLSAGSFSIEYGESMGLPITRLHKAWYEYMMGVTRGTLVPTNDSHSRKIIDYQASMYYFTMEPDGQTIQYWSKYTGVFPTGFPSSNHASRLGDWSGINVSIPYSYVFKEDMDPRILTDFNKVWNIAELSSKSLLESAGDALTAGLGRLLPGGGTGNYFDDAAKRKERFSFTGWLTRGIYDSAKNLLTGNIANESDVLSGAMAHDLKLVTPALKDYLHPDNEYISSPHGDKQSSKRDLNYINRVEVKWDSDRKRPLLAFTESEKIGVFQKFGGLGNLGNQSGLDDFLEPTLGG